ncbi:MAG: ATP-dependent DNA helicase, partial [Bacteroidia bacterium]|nr:ATP-dependent DNA helicase [Bacteroidia bacterium]
SMNTRSELEEERRLFYVALTRAEKQVYLTYALSRYRWGKLTDAEPSRFIEEIDDQFLDILTPVHERRFNPMLDASIFGDVPPNKIRTKKATKRTTKKPEPFKLSVPKKLKPVKQVKDQSITSTTELRIGQQVNHQRFGKGVVTKIEGKGADLKAEIKFDHAGIKRLLLRFAKLEILN